MTARTEYLQTVVQLDYGSLTNPTSLLNLISHLRRIRSESSTRHDFIGNWLNCLRDHSGTEASAAAVTAAAAVTTAPTKRKNRHSVASGQRGRGGGRGGGRGRGGTGGAAGAAGGDYARSIRQSSDPKLRIRRGQREVVVQACKFSFPNNSTEWSRRQFNQFPMKSCRVEDSERIRRRCEMRLRSEVGLVNEP